MKILFVTDLIPIEENEKCSRALLDIVKGFIEKGMEVDVVRPNFLINSKLRKKSIKPNGKIEIDGVTVWNLNFNLPFVLPFKNFDTTGYDVVVAHMPSGILFCESLDIPDCVKKIYAVHQSDIDILTNPVYSFYFKEKLKNAYWSCDRIIARSPHLKKKLSKILKGIERKITVVPSGIAEEIYVDEADIDAKFHAPIRFVTAANLIKRKKTDIILKALSKYKDKEFSLTIIGDGPERENLEKLAERLRLGERVEFLGELPHGEVIQKFRESDIFVLPSVKETLGLAYLEAMACGCLCIGTLDTGIDGIVRDGYNGYLIQPSRWQLIKKLRDIFDKDAFRLQVLAKKSLKTAQLLTRNKAVEVYLKELSR